MLLAITSYDSQVTADQHYLALKEDAGSSARIARSRKGKAFSSESGRTTSGDKTGPSCHPVQSNVWQAA